MTSKPVEASVNCEPSKGQLQVENALTIATRGWLRRHVEFVGIQCGIDEDSCKTATSHSMATKLLWRDVGDRGSVAGTDVQRH